MMIKLKSWISVGSSFFHLIFRSGPLFFNRDNVFIVRFQWRRREVGCYHKGYSKILGPSRASHSDKVNTRWHVHLMYPRGHPCLLFAICTNRYLIVFDLKQYEGKYFIKKQEEFFQPEEVIGIFFPFIGHWAVGKVKRFSAGFFSLAGYGLELIGGLNSYISGNWRGEYLFLKQAKCNLW